MTIEANAALTLAQWLSPAYPVGAFAYSHGLEQVTGQGDVTDAFGLRDWLADVLNHGGGRTDAILLVQAYRADDPAEIDATSRAFAPSAERLKETVLQGAAFAQTTAALWESPLPDYCYPVAVGAAARAQGLPLDLTVQMYLQAFVSNLVAAAQRLAAIGQTEAQGIVKDLNPDIARISAQAQTASLDDLSGSCFMADIASMRHETQYSRIFRT